MDELLYWGLYINILAIKLKALKHYLKVWNREVSRNVATNKVATLNQISVWDKKERKAILSFEVNKARRKAMEENCKWEKMEEVSWRQKSWELWLKKGDKNTKFFHEMVNACRRRNYLDKASVLGCWGGG